MFSLNSNIYNHYILKYSMKFVKQLIQNFKRKVTPLNSLERALSEAYSSKPELIPSTKKVINFISGLNGFNGTQKELVDRIVQEFNVCVDSGDYLDNVQKRGVVSFKYLGEDSEGNTLSRKVMLKGETPVIEGLNPKEVRVLAATQLLMENSTAPLIGYDCVKEVLRQGNSVIPFDFGEYFEFGESCVEGVIPVKTPKSLDKINSKKNSRISISSALGIGVVAAVCLGVSGLYKPLVESSKRIFEPNQSKLEKKLIEEASTCPFEIQPVFKEDKSPAKIVTEEKEIMGMPWDTYSNSFKFKHKEEFNLSCISKMAFAYVPLEKGKNKTSDLDSYLVFSSNQQEHTGRLGISKYIEIYKFNKNSRNWEEKDCKKTNRPFATFCVGKLLDSDAYSIVAIPVTKKWMTSEDNLEIYTFNSDGSLRREKTNLKLSGGDILALDVSPDEKGLDEILFSEYRSRLRVARLSRDTNGEVRLNDLKSSLVGSYPECEEKDTSGCVLSSSGIFIPNVFFRNISDFSTQGQKRIVLGGGTDSKPEYKFLSLDILPINTDEVVLSDCRKNHSVMDNYSTTYASLKSSDNFSLKPVGMACSDYGTPFIWLQTPSGSFPMQIFDKPYQDRNTLDNVHYITSGVVDGVSTIAVSTNLRAMIGYARDIKKK